MGNGRFEPDAKFAGRIAKLFVDQGDIVEAGQVVAMMQTEPDKLMFPDQGVDRSGALQRARGNRPGRSAGNSLRADRAFGRLGTQPTAEPAATGAAALR